MALVPLSLQRAYRSCRFGLRDCRGLRVEFDLVRGLEQVLPDCRHRQLGVGFGQPEISGTMKAKEALHRAEALPDPEAAFRNQLVKAFFRGAPRTIASRLPHDPVAVAAA